MKIFIYTALIIITFLFSGCATSMHPLMKAASNGQMETVKSLVEKGADINIRESSGMTPLLYAVSSCKLDTVTFLVHRGARTDVKAEYGWPAIHYAVYGCSASPEKALSIINILLEKGCDISDVDSTGHTAYWIAMEYMFTDMVVLLRRKGVTEQFRGGSAGDFDEALRSPSFFTPPHGTYIISAGQESSYQRAIEDCNHLVVPYRKGLLMATGPIGYGLGVLADKNSVPAKHQGCMGKMGFKCETNCSK